MPPKTFQPTNPHLPIHHYHPYKQHIPLIPHIPFQSYPFSIPSTPILPNPTRELNQKPFQFYNNLIHRSLKHPILPFLTFY
ncbi:family 1 glycosylhydrolase, partial [Priestia megaterium]|uniref:family 1 glycosylhydrolase n=1 Tax=Priestia megaterium TaxID=1404 RepID=UPI0037093F93